ncbi:hypothetical protein [Stenotrophomonas maltophilia]|uniref:hypothetical protein n=1 Tax=Stenotrophomonas maltophilia TaxID=40324 RepID=UPI0009B27FE0|nr:hypothetical protein [Stenotrophomonas maltophilia]ELK2666203.1 hypothetical protein [Stenotrophomonas maltophilia]MBH1377777.1 hypothetical protein [Stenotrophomonas maltophilia]MBH1440465.1 hypothetical protein [Stenotrophomonas maltophilia]MBH1559083.1 hypothetical protein [Stenotrophomonas maltophilia]MBN4987281.1 hypothetical protein [Stenotrophomonas maltophilia]
MGAAEKLVGQPIIGAVIFEGITVTDGEGRPAQLAVIDGRGRVLAVGPEVAKAAWSASVEAYRNHLRGHGHLRAIKHPGASQVMRGDYSAKT